MHVAILVPFRDAPGQNRAAHLRCLCDGLPRVLAAACGPHTFRIYIGHAVEDGRPFARGRVLNALYQLSMHSAQPPARVILHDVDLLPDATRAAAYFDFSAPVLALARHGGEYEGMRNYIGGVLALPPSVYAAVNGFPNEMEGWGGEDDAMHDRLSALGVDVVAPAQGSMRNLELEPDTAGSVRARDAAACPKPERRALRQRWKSRDAALSGAAELRFSAAPLSPDAATGSGPLCAQYRVLAPVQLRPPWHMAFSSTTRLPYFANADTGDKTYVPPQ